jgi:hypothetical protein
MGRLCVIKESPEIGQDTHGVLACLTTERHREDINPVNRINLAYCESPARRPSLSSAHQWRDYMPIFTIQDKKLVMWTGTSVSTSLLRSQLICTMFRVDRESKGLDGKKGGAVAYSIEHHADSSYVKLTLQGNASLAEFEEARSGARDQLARLKIGCILVDARQLDNMVTTLELFQFHSSHNQKLPHGVRIAGLVRSDQMEDGLFAENVAQNRGVMMKMFTDDQTALAWLSGQTD